MWVVAAEIALMFASAVDVPLSVIVVRLVQSWNVEACMLKRPSPIVTLVILVCLLNALAPMVVTLFGMTMSPTIFGNAEVR